MKSLHVKLTMRKSLTITISKIIYGIPRIATCDTKVRIPLYNVLYLNQKLYQFGIAICSKCCFCDIYCETPLPLFYECVYAQNV